MEKISTQIWCTSIDTSREYVEVELENCDNAGCLVNPPFSVEASNSILKDLDIELESPEEDAYVCILIYAENAPGKKVKVQTDLKIAWEADRVKKPFYLVAVYFPYGSVIPAQSAQSTDPIFGGGKKRTHKCNTLVINADPATPIHS